MADEGVRFPIEADTDEASFERAGQQAGDATARGVRRSRLSSAIEGTIERSLDKAARTAGRGDVFDALGKNARVAAASINPLERKLEEANKDVLALKESGEAMRATLAKTGADPRIFAGFDRSIDKSLRLLRDFEQELQQGTATQNKFDQLEVGLTNANRTAQRQVAGIQSTLKTLTVAEAKAAEALRAEQQQAATQRLQESRLANSRRIVEEQRAGAQILAETRIAGQQQLQADRQRARTRIELVRFTFQQIRVLERGIAGAFRAAGTILNTTAGAIGSTLNRIGGAFRRSNRDLNDGLRGALIQREQSISRSFSRQSETIRRETLEASATIRRFEAQASTGVAGALTGRSSLGALFGGGLAIGGGFAAFQGLRNGLDVGGDFVQGLAVLGAQLELTDDQMAAVRQQAIDLGNDITLPGVSALDAAQAIQILAKQFANLGDVALPAAQAAAKGVLQLSRAAGVSAEEAARVVGASVNVFGLAADKAVVAADQITNALTKSAGVGFGDFADAFTQSAGVVNLFTGPAAEAERTLSEFNAALAVLAKNGLIGSDAGTSLKQFFLQANRGTEDSISILAQVAEQAGVMGDVFFDAEGRARSFGETLDILRRGTAGLTDADFSRTLQKLFGSDAARAAAFLLRTTTEEFDALTLSIEQQGSAANIAAAQNTGLRGALDALGSVIETQQIKTYERFQGVLGRVVLRFAELLNAFFEGRGRLGVLRDALIGAAAALSGLLAAKLVGEAFQFMAIGLRAALTPLGALVVTVAALGAAVNVLADRSPAFRDALGELGDTLIEVFGPLLRSALRGLQRLAAFAGDVLAPQIERLAVFIADNLNDAVRATFDYITDTAIPALERFGGFVIDELIPPLERLGTLLIEGVTRGFEIARGAIEGLFNTVEPLIEPAISGFRRLGDAVQAAFGEGDFSGILPGLQAVGTGLVSSLGNIGEVIIEALRPQLSRVIDFIRDFLSGKGGGAGASAGRSVKDFLVGPFQEAVETLGFFIGNLVTDPRLISALEKLVGLAVLTGVNFVKGLGRGIADNLPDLGRMFGGQLQGALQEGLSAALSNPFEFAQIIGVALLAAPIIRAFVGAGEAGAKGVATGFGRGLRTSLASSPDFLRGFFGGPGALERQAAREATTASNAMRREFERINRDLGRAGTIGLLSPPGGLITQADVDHARSRLALVKEQLGEVGATALIARGRLRDGLRGLADGFAEFAQNAGSTGRAIGSILGAGIVSGVGAALSGQQLGSATSGAGVGIGLAGVIGSALLPFATLPATIAAPVAGATLLIGGITAALSASGRAADDAKARIEAWAETLSGTSSESEAITVAAERLADAAVTIGNTDARDLFRGFNFAELSQDVLNGGDAIEEAFIDIARRAGLSSTAIQAVLTEAERTGRGIESVVRGAQSAFATEGLRGFVNELNDTEFSVFDVADAMRFIEGQVRDVDGALAQLDLRSTFETVLPTLNQNVIPSLKLTAGAITGVDDAISGSQSQMDRYVGSLIAMGEAQAAIEAGNIEAINEALGSLNQQRTDSINSRIGELTGQLDAARVAAESAMAAILDIVAPVADTAATRLGDAIQSIPTIAEGLGDTLARAGENIFAATDLADLADQFTSPLREAVAAAFTNNPALTAAQLREQFAVPLQTALDQARVQIGTDDAGAPIFRPLSAAERGFFEEQMSGLFNGALDTAIGQFQLRQADITNLQDQLTAAQLQLPVRVVFSAADIQRELLALGLNVPFSSIAGFLDDAAAAEAQRSARAVSSRDFADVSRAESPLPPQVVFNQTLNQTISGGATPTVTASESATAMRTAAVNGLLPRLTSRFSPS